MGGPSRTLSSYGIVNDDWIITNGGDGFESQIDPKDPNIVYAQSQYGGLVRYDKKSGESISIKPQPPKGEAYRWNWNAPLIISPHSHTRLYFAANKLFRSDNRGDTWKPVSSDLSRQLDRNKLKVMGKIQSPEAVSKNASTSLFGNIVSLSESPLVEGLIYVGTDDGLIQVSEDGGGKWRRITKVPGVPEMTYVSCLLTSRYEAGTVYASFDGRKNSDLGPYLLKSTDRGKSWRSIKADLPKRGTVFTIAEDHVKAGLLFVGTEFGVFFTIDGGGKWVQLKSGLPTTAVKDIAIQERENDLVLATFGRGFYILDDYTPLRHLKPGSLKEEAVLFPVKDALMFIRTRARYGQGSTYYAAKNPPIGAVFTYYLKDSIKTKKEKRKAAEKKAQKKGVPITYPTFEQLRTEDEEEPPYLLFIVTDEAGSVVRKLKTKAAAGLQRLTWDFCYASTDPIDEDSKPFSGSGTLALPGKYKVTIGKFADGVFSKLAGPQVFEAKALDNTTLPAADRKALVEFQGKVAELSRVVRGTSQVVRNLSDRVKRIKIALSNTPGASLEMVKAAASIDGQVKEVRRAFFGDRSISRRNANQPPGISRRVGNLIYSHWRSTSAPTQTMKDQYRIAGEEYEIQVKKLKQLIEEDLKKLEQAMEAVGAPWTPGRIPEWKK